MSDVLWFIAGYCTGMIVLFAVILFLNWPTDRPRNVTWDEVSPDDNVDDEGQYL